MNQRRLINYYSTYSKRHTQSTSDVCTTTTQRVPNDMVVHGVWSTLGSRCTNVAGSLTTMASGTRWVVVVQTSLVHWVTLWRLEPTKFVQRLPLYKRRWLTGLLHRVWNQRRLYNDYPTCPNVHGVWNTSGCCCTNVACSLGNTNIAENNALFENKASKGRNNVYMIRF